MHAFECIGTVGDIAKAMNSRLKSYRATETYVIFDQYDCVSAKDHERQKGEVERAQTHTI